jgi:hypothetical protein
LTEYDNCVCLSYHYLANCGSFFIHFILWPLRPPLLTMSSYLETLYDWHFLFIKRRDHWNIYKIPGMAPPMITIEANFLSKSMRKREKGLEDAPCLSHYRCVYMAISTRDPWRVNKSRWRKWKLRLSRLSAMQSEVG